MTQKRPHILVVDDQSYNVKIIFEILRDEHFSLSKAGDGDTAWQMMNSEPELYDVILLDRVMPNMDGMQLLEKIKSHAVLKFCPVIMQSANSDRDSILEGINAGAYYYLNKSFDAEMLLSIVHSAIGERLNYLAMKQLLEDNQKSLGLLDVGQFRYRSIEEAQSLATLLAKACPDPEQIINGLSELMVNAIEHGNLGITYDEKTVLIEAGTLHDEISRKLKDEQYKCKYAKVNFKRSEEKIEIVIFDEGDGFDWKKYLYFETERVTHNHGRGIAIANCSNYAEVEYQGKGNIVKMSVLLLDACLDKKDEAGIFLMGVM